MNVTKFKIHAICLVRDEADIIEDTLRAAMQWCDRIYVYDNGSEDNTWEIIHRLSTESDKVIPFLKDASEFTNGLRGKVFSHYRNEACPQDWWCILDADEFYIDDPRTFLAKVPEYFDAVWNSSFQYYFTDLDAARYEVDPEAYGLGESVKERLRYYRNNWSELRFFRHSEKLNWSASCGHPAPLKAVYPVRIWLKHYQYRHPDQIIKRIKIRQQARKPFIHEAVSDWQDSVLDTGSVKKRELSAAAQDTRWQDRIIPAQQLDYDHGDGRLVARNDDLPEIPLPIALTLKLLIVNVVKRIRGKVRRLLRV